MPAIPFLTSQLQKRRSILPILSVVAFWLCFAPPASAAEVGCPTQVGRCAENVIWLTGEIMPGDAEKLRTELLRKGPHTSLVVFANSPGGSINEGIKIGHLLRKYYISSAVGWIASKKKPVKVFYPEAAYLTSEGRREIPELSAKNAVCAYACMDAWLGGYRRYGVAFLGVPHAEEGMGKDSKPPINDANLHNELTEYYRVMDVPDSFTEAESAAFDGRKLIPVIYVDDHLLRRSEEEDRSAKQYCGQVYPSLKDVVLSQTTMDEVARAYDCAATLDLKNRMAVWPLMADESL